MIELRNYLESHRSLRFVLMSIGFLGASFSLYMGVALSFFVQHADSLLILSFVLLALALDIGIGWTLHLHTRGKLRATILLSSAGILAGAVLTSMAVWREHWPQLVKEIWHW
jgi:hypothetical protein